MSGVWVFAETRDGKVIKVVNEMLNASKDIGAKLGEEVAAVLLGSGVESLANELAGMGAKKVYLADDAKLEKYTPDAYAKVIVDLVKQNEPSALLFGNSLLGKDLAPTVAAKLGVGLCSDCTGLEVDGENRLVFTRPIYAGKAITTVVCDAKPQMGAIRPNVLPPGEVDAGASANISPAGVRTSFGTRFLKRTLILEPARRARARQRCCALPAEVHSSRVLPAAGWAVHGFGPSSLGVTL